VPIYLGTNDGLLGLPYEAVLRAMELSCFPSFYEPWGYTPEESLAVGVPTVTSDLAGFGRWALEKELGPANGVLIFRREAAARRPGGYDDLVAPLADMLEMLLSERRDPETTARVCRETAQLTAWSGLIASYLVAFAQAQKIAQERAPAPMPKRKPHALPVVPPQQGHRPRLSTFQVSATYPAPLQGLERLARNFWWSWDPEATQLFRDLAPAKWEEQRHNPITFLREVFTEDVKRFESDAAYLARLQRVLARFDAYMAVEPGPLTLSGGNALTTKHPVAYFCAEFGVHESLKVYSGGL